MQSSWRLSRPNSSAARTLEKPFITVEKSFEVSFDYTPADLYWTLDQNTMAYGLSEGSLVLGQSTTYRADTSSNKSMSGRARLRSTLTHEEDKDNQEINLVSSGSKIRRSHDTLDIHEALRSQVPQFKQSRRWAKAYLHDQTQPKPAATVSVSSPKRKAESPQTRSTSPRGEPSPANSHVSDNESDHFGFCRPAHVPGWQVFRKHRPHNLSKISNTSSPRRVKSTKPNTDSSQISERRVVLPRAIQGRIGNQKDQLRLISISPKRWKRRRPDENSPNSSISAVSEVLVQEQPRCLGSPLSSLHDYEKVQRFSQECVNMLSGLDFGEEWRLSLVEPALSASHKPVMEASQNATKPARDWTSRNKSNSTPHLILDGGQDAFQRFQRAQRANMEEFSASNRAEVYKKSVPIVASTQISLADANATASKGFAHILNAQSREDFAISYRSSKSSFSQPLPQQLTGGLKEARSVDTLTEIEAQVEDVPAKPTHQLERKPSTFTLTSSPKRQRPSGDPPVRPLPDLPKDDASDAKSSLYRKPSFASSHGSKLMCGAYELADPFKTMSVQTILHIPSSTSSQSGSLSSNTSNFPVQSRPVTVGPTCVKEAFQTNAVDARSKASSSTSSVPGKAPAFPNTANHPHIKPGLISQQPRPVQSTSLKNANSCSPLDNAAERALGSRSRPLGRTTSTSTLSRPPENPYISSRSEGPDANHSKTQSVLGSQGNFALAIPMSVQEGHLRVLKERKTSQDLNGRSSKTSSISRNCVTRSRNLKPAASSPNLQQKIVPQEKHRQRLARSQIMVVVDSIPQTAVVCADALNPTLSVRTTQSQPASPEKQLQHKGPKSMLTPRKDKVSATSAGVDDLAELIDIVKPPASIQRRRSCRSLRSQGSTKSAQSRPVKHTLDRISPVANAARFHVGSVHRAAVEVCDSEAEEVPLLKVDDTLVPTQTRTSSRATVRKTHARKDTPLTILLKEEVRRADVELENLKKYEQRIEYLQLHLEQTLKVWGRMSENGKKQYLASTFGGLDRSESSKSPLKANKDTHTAVTGASSTPKRHSNVQRLDEAVSRSLKEALDFAKAHPYTFRSSSVTSSATRTGTCTDTDTDWSTDNANIRRGRRGSEDSLTDPQDYECSDVHVSGTTKTAKQEVNLRNSIQTVFKGKCPIAIESKRAKSETLGRNLDDFRARLQASLPAPRQSSTPTPTPTAESVAIPARRFKQQTPTRERHYVIGTAARTPSRTHSGSAAASAELGAAPAMQKETSSSSFTSSSSSKMSISRFAVAPWEELESEVTRRRTPQTSTNSSNEDVSVNRHFSCGNVNHDENDCHDRQRPDFDLNIYLNLTKETLRTDQMDAMLAL